MVDIEIPALGYYIPLGTLYDSRTHTFLKTSIFGSGAPRATQTINARYRIEQSRLDGGSLANRCKTMRVSPELAASILAGWVKPSASGAYLLDDVHVGSASLRALRRTITSHSERIDTSNDEFLRVIRSHTDELANATHVVREVAWGTECVVSMSSKESSRFVNEHDLDDCLSRLQEAGMRSSGQPNYERAEMYNDLLDFRVYGDMLGHDNPATAPYRTVVETLHLLFRYLAKQDKGYPVTYTMIPVTDLDKDLPTPVCITQPSSSLMTDIYKAFQRLDRCASDFFDGTSPTPAYETREKALQSNKHVHPFYKDYRNLLYQVRKGNVNAKHLEKLLQRFLAGKYSEQRGERSDVLQEAARDKRQPKSEPTKSDPLPFLNKIMALGAQYHKQKESPFDIETIREHQDAYVLEFDNTVSSENSKWQTMTSIVLHALREPSVQAHVILLDLSGGQSTAVKPRLSRYYKGVLVKQDVWEQHEKLVQRACIYHRKSKLRKNKEHPDLTEVRPLRIPCGGPACDSDRQWDWICSRCYTTVDYIGQGVLSCTCGQWDFENSTFRCPGAAHGPLFVKHRDSHQLHTQLQALKPCDTINILVFGEAGVGKTTFVNAFSNYLSFPSLGEASKHERLECCKPFAFLTQNIDDQGSIVETIVMHSGNLHDQVDSAAETVATPRTQVHSVRVSSKIVRLIDAPSFSDSFSSEISNEDVMVDVLSALEGHKQFHCILVLLKANVGRLSVAFGVGLKNILSRLHCSATQNIVFGFTNARTSNWMPGDAFSPLHLFLGDFPVLQSSIAHSTIYCFESDSFRFLAAQKHGITIGEQSDFENSWEKSTIEVRRLLNYCSGLEPHLIHITLAFMDCRALIVRLARPLVQVAQAILATIAMNEKIIVALQDGIQRQKDNRPSKKVSIEAFKTEKIDKPRTVCSNADCIDTDHNGVGLGADGVEQIRTVYKTACHEGCSSQAQEGSTSDRELSKCSSMYQRGSKKGLCKRCGHSWREHLHIRYELKPCIIEIQDHPDEKEIIAAKDSRRHCEGYIAECQFEYRKTVQAAAEFTLYLRRNSMAPFRDAIAESLNSMIDQEKSKVWVDEEKGKARAGGSATKMRDLESFRAEHETMVLDLSRNVTSGRRPEVNEEGIKSVARSLSCMPHFGDDFRRVFELA